MRAWNQAVLALKGETAILEINGTLVYEHRLEPSNDRLFGFYHDKAKTAARVRQVVLKGNWPTNLDEAELAHLLGRRPGAAGPERQGPIEERFVGLDAGAVLRRSRALAPAARYEALRDWVVPGPARPEARHFGDFSPAYPVPVEGEKWEGRRVETGGDLEAPALDLVAVAHDLGKLDELAAQVERLNQGSERGKLALLALVRAEQGRDAEADDALKRLKGLLARVPADAPEWKRWPELTAASHTLSRPALRPAARALLDMLAVEKPHAPAPVNGYDVDPETGLTRTEPARGRRERLAEAHPARARACRPARRTGSQAVASPWVPVTHGRAQTRGQGHPRPHWSARDGAFVHDPGHESDALYFGVPLRGDFEVTCELWAAPGREAQVVYGGLGFGIKPDGTHYELMQDNHVLPELPLDPPLKGLKEWLSYRLVVRGRSYTVFVNGEKVHEQGIPEDADPWLALLAHAEQAPRFRNLKILGQPHIPDRLELSGPPGLTGWHASYYDEPMLGDRPAWEKRGTEIFSRLNADPAGSKQESLLQYHRPLLENGAIAYEFFHEPGKVMVEPALDRLVFRLDPDGVKIHWLTDAQYDRRGLAPDNTTVEPAHRQGPGRLPLKPRDWNHLVLALSGDAVTLTLNGTLIYERPLEAINQRAFGFFHYADETEVRVRNVVYRGTWPRVLPDDVSSR